MNQSLKHRIQNPLHLELNAIGFLKLHSRGCLDTDLCGKTTAATILGAGVTSSFSCCQTDLCNRASSVHVSVTVALSAALLAWWNQTGK